MNERPLYQLAGIKRVTKQDKVILDIDSLSLPAGGVTAIVGPNGAGKTTLLGILAFLEKPDQGQIRFQGTPVGPRDFCSLRRRVTMVDQAPFLFKGTVFQNVAYGLRVRGVPPGQWSGRVEEALSRLDLAGFGDRVIKGLSGGEAQRVAIARALVFGPQVILLDEPTAGVDVARVDMVENLITELHAASDISILFSTHDLAQANRLTDRVIHLAEGRMAPSSMENLFNGQAAKDGAANLVHLQGGTTLRVNAVPSGPVRLGIPAAAVEVKPFTGAEDRINHFDSIIARMELRGTKIRLLLEGRLNLRAEMVREDVVRKGLGVGDRVIAIVPPEAIHLFRGLS